jgi:hypothetical protein
MKSTRKARGPAMMPSCCSSRRNGLALVLLLVMVACLVGVCVGCASANPIDDLYNIIFPGSNVVSSIEVHNSSYADITKAELSNDKIAVEYLASNIPQEGGITAELFCQDNTGRFVSMWGGSVSSISGSFEFSKEDIQRESLDGCYFEAINNNVEIL